MTSIAELEKLINETHEHGEQDKTAIATKEAELTKLKDELRGLEELNARRRKELEALKRSAKPFTMYDTIEPSLIPPNPEAVAGYVGGNWPTFNELVTKFPKAKHLSIAVNSAEDAECLDVEAGDASPADVPAWVHRQEARDQRYPVIYASLSTWPQIEAVVGRLQIRRWVADYDGIAEVPAGYNAKQYTDHALGRNLGASICDPHFLP
jgi:hypothetical protein